MNPPSNKSQGSLREDSSPERGAPDLELVKPAESTDPQLLKIHAAIHALQRLTEVFQRRREQLASSVGITEREWRVLDGISSEDFMPSMFARRRESTPAAVSKILRQLIDKGLVSVTVSKADGRQRDYALTPKGKRTMLRLRKQRERAVQDVWLGLDGDQLATFTSFGFDLAARLEEYAGLGDQTSRPAATELGEFKD
ncbi:MAG: MarR family winged helix-turn-helix transcriptional regulator [Polyangiaceae bacterium]